MLELKFLHVIAMFGAVTLFVGGEVMLVSAARSRDVPAIRRLAHTTERTDLVGLLLFVLGIGVGFATAVKAGMDLTAQWLVLAYGLVGVLLLAGPLFFLPRGKKLVAAVDASPDDAPSPELAALIQPSKMMGVLIVDIAIWTTIIFLMVRKPFL